MASSEERMKILKMIEEGKITPEEGARLLSALSDGRQSPPFPGRGPGGGRWLRIRVTDIATGRSKASVQIPLGLMDAVRSGMTGKIIDVTDEEDGEHVEIYVE